MRPLIYLVLIGIGFAAASSFASVNRYALILSQQLGNPHDEQLKYSARDAEKIYNALISTGNFSNDHIILESYATPDNVRHHVQVLKQRLATQKHTGKTVFLLYYSGHGDKQSLHMAGRQLHLTDLKIWIDDIPSDLKVVILDACNSGSFLKLKGVKRADPIKIDFDDRLNANGQIFIASSSSDEYAHESELYKGSIFTHFFTSGLLGEADLSNDRKITIYEAYQYAYNHTVHATSLQSSYTQHPNYKFDVKGSDQVVIADLDNSQATLILSDNMPGRYYLFRLPDKLLIGEFESSGDTPKRIALTAGTYIIERIHRSRRSQATIAVYDDGRHRSIDQTIFKPIHVESSLLKGKGPKAYNQNIFIMFGFIRPPFPSQEVIIPIYQIGYSHRFFYIDVIVRATLTQDDHIATLPNSLSEVFTVGTYIIKPIIIKPIDIGIGINADYFWGDEELSTSYRTRDISGTSLGLVAKLSYDLNRFISATSFLELNGIHSFSDGDNDLLPKITFGLSVNF